MFLDVKQCEGGCNHRYKREEEFYGLSLSVTTGNLVDSLRLFVQEEVLEGVPSLIFNVFVLIVLYTGT